VSINNVTLVGNCGSDPEARYFESGAVVAEFSLALNNPPKDGQSQDPDWVEVKCWNKTAQIAVDYLKKGHRVGIVGRLKQEKWTDRDGGQQRSKLTVVADRLELLTPRESATETGAAGATRQVVGRTAPAHDPMDDEIPF
jgi:single-strand DNA-binding protein